MEYNPFCLESDHSPVLKTCRSFTVTCLSHVVTTTVTSDPSAVDNWICRIRRVHDRHLLRGRLVVGLGVQWRPNYKRGPPNPPATLQLCVGAQCLIFQLMYAGSSPNSLRRFLSDPQISFVGVRNKNDKAMLRRSHHNLSLSRIVELREVATRHRGLPKRVSIERLVASALGGNGVKKSSRIGSSNWEAYWLSLDQVEHASVDAFLSFLLGKSLKVWDYV